MPNPPTRIRAAAVGQYGRWRGVMEWGGIEGGGCLGESHTLHCGGGGGRQLAKIKREKEDSFEEIGGISNVKRKSSGRKWHYLGNTWLDLMALIFIRRTGGARAWPDDWRRRGTFAAKRKRGLTVVNRESMSWSTETENIVTYYIRHTNVYIAGLILR